MTKLDSTYFWAHEFRCTAERASCTTIPHVLLAKTIISNFDVTIQGQQNVIELQVTVNDTVLVEVLECQADLGGIEPKKCEHFNPPKQGKDQAWDLLCPLEAELATLNVQHEITTTDILHDEIDTSFSLETSM